MQRPPVQINLVIIKPQLVLQIPQAAYLILAQHWATLNYYSHMWHYEGRNTTLAPSWPNALTWKFQSPAGVALIYMYAKCYKTDVHWDLQIRARI